MKWNRPIDEIDSFLSLAVRGGLISQSQIGEHLKQFRQDEFTIRGTIAELIPYLTGRGVLTSWQCKKLRENKYKGFFVDNYKILDHIATEDGYSYYLAQDTAPSKRVNLRIHPPRKNGWWNTTMDYNVESPFD